MKLSDYQRSSIEDQCKPLIERLKAQYVLKHPNKRFDYLIDLYIKWYRDYLYFCGKYKSESPHRLLDEFEYKLARLKIMAPNSYQISYMRHTGKWFLIAEDLTLSECLEMIEDTPIFHPV